MSTRLVPLGLAALLLAAPAAAHDYGQQGAVFPVIEADLLSVIQQRLTTMQASGAIDRANRQLAERTAARVRRPAPVPGIAPATEERRWTFDPTITVREDLRDGRGRIVVAAGTRVNPLDTVPLRQRLVFLDGDDPAQVAWARSTTTALNAKLILVGGSPFALMKAEQRRFYFDQQGTLTRHFGIHAVPALVEQQGRTLAIRELVIRGTKGDRK
ncbi:Protein TraW [Sphingomonas sp. EC-HK361]|uniref:type-F conjugative transfer system protein TraW n=1 Tax=Sphingomonas sp. EC-HK361 TaxID=2038397 RepID=UPI0012582CA4|nr:type-F conjugative transfer system protein TraW [Sphingomonas sp. EC-HK361]VVT10086.1 Protein TraW [Sphingomonas sp. EC-HK361]